MFNKKNCNGCGKKINTSYDFCPFCGNNVIGKKEDMGMLGRGDEINNFEKTTEDLFSGFGGGILNKMLKSTMKMLEKELEKELQEQKKHPQSNMQLFINGKRVDIPQISNSQHIPKEKKQISSKHFSEANQKKFISMKKQEPKTEIKRIGDLIIYEIKLPKVKSIKDISIIKLENSVEIKAISKNNSYVKTIPISISLTNYTFNNEKLILEFESSN